MPDYNEIIAQSETNVKALNDKLGQLDKLHQDIVSLKDTAGKIPIIFESKFNEIISLADSYTNILGTATKKYLDGTNTLFTEKLNELTAQTSVLQKEITRLVNTDLTGLFESLQKEFISQARKDLAEELKKIDSRSQDLKDKIKELSTEVARLEKIDLEKHFDKLQKTLADIFNAINAINLTLTSLTQTLTAVSQSLSGIQSTLNSNHTEIKKTINSSTEVVSKHFADQNSDIKTQFDLLNSEVKSLAVQNNLLHQELKKNSIIQIIGFILIIIVISIVVIKVFG